MQTPLPPPSWIAKPSDMTLKTPPTCKCCAGDLTSRHEFPLLPGPPPKLRHSSSTVLKTTPDNLTPLRHHHSRPQTRTFPKWMAQLPSNRTSGNPTPLRHHPSRPPTRTFPRWMAQLPSNRPPRKTSSHPSSCVPSRFLPPTETTHPLSRLRAYSSPALNRSSPSSAQNRDC